MPTWQPSERPTALSNDPAAAIILIGFMGSGKTAVGRELARRLEQPFYDLDDLIEREAALAITAIFRSLGETYFRTLELFLLRRLLTDVTVAGTAAPVIATGGGIVTTPAARDLLRRVAGTVIHLRVDATTAARRVAADGATRPLLNGRHDIPLPEENRLRKIQGLLHSRRPCYEACSRLVADTDGLSVIEVVDRLITALGNRSATASRPDSNT
ncbi:MAG: shikimate kinase [Deltaproteobacteria bacterium]|nr:shikimate kinase [Candidatus Anaeroferrophillacea bacterium]